MTKIRDSYKLQCIKYKTKTKTRHFNFPLKDWGSHKAL